MYFTGDDIVTSVCMNADISETIRVRAIKFGYNMPCSSTQLMFILEFLYATFPAIKLPAFQPLSVLAAEIRA